MESPEVADQDPTAGHPVGPHGRARAWDRWAGIAGLVFVLLDLANLLTPATPDAALPVAESTAQLAADLTGHQISLWLGFLADAAFLVFLAGLWGRLRRFEGPGGLFATTFLVAGVVNVTLILVARGLYLALVQYGSFDEAQEPVLASVTVIADWVGAAGLPAAMVGSAAVAGAVLTTGALPRWLGWLAAATAALTLLSLAWFIQTATEGVLSVADVIGSWLTVAFFLAASLLLILRPGGQPGPPRR